MELITQHLTKIMDVGRVLFHVMINLLSLILVLTILLFLGCWLVIILAKKTSTKHLQTFKQLYGGVFEQFKDLEFFQRVQIYVDDLWQKFNKDGYIECPVSKHLYKKDKLEDMKPQKLLNYVLQNLETAMNVRILWDIFKSLKNRKTKLVLYTYDSFLFDFDESEVGLIDEIKQIIKNYKLQIKESYGSNYDFR